MNLFRALFKLPIIINRSIVLTISFETNAHTANGPPNTGFSRRATKTASKFRFILVTLKMVFISFFIKNNIPCKSELLWSNDYFNYFCHLNLRTVRSIKQVGVFRKYLTFKKNSNRLETNTSSCNFSSSFRVFISR